MKVLYLIDSLETGGAEKSLLEMTRHFQRVTPVICTVYQGETLKPSFERYGIRVIQLGFKGKYEYFSAVRRLNKVLRHESPDLIHTTLARSHFIGRTAGALAGIRVVSSLVSESYSRERIKNLSLSLRSKLMATKKIDSFTSRLADHFVANSETVKQHVSQALGIDKTRITVIYRGRDAAVFKLLKRTEIYNLRCSLNIPENMFILLNVGRLVASKLQKNIILAVKSLLPSLNVRLLIAGEGPYREQLLRSITELQLRDNVTLLGNRDDIPLLLQLGDIFVFPSSFEGFPGALMEAMFAGRPIIASDIPVHREMIEHKKSGILCDSSPSEIADAVLWMLNHPEERESMGDRARDFARATFAIEQIAVQHENLYQRLLEQSHG